jgi:hypothetical protein
MSATDCSNNIISIGERYKLTGLIPSIPKSKYNKELSIVFIEPIWQYNDSTREIISFSIKWNNPLNRDNQAREIIESTINILQQIFKKRQLLYTETYGTENWETILQYSIRMNNNDIPDGFNKDTFISEFIQLCNTRYPQKKKLLWRKYHRLYIKEDKPKIPGAKNDRYKQTIPF